MKSVTRRLLPAVAALCVAVSPVAGAGDAATLVLTEERCVALALVGNADLARARQQAVRADETRNQAIGLALPDVDLSARYTEFGDVPESEIFGQRFTFGPDKQREIHLSVSQWLYSGSVGAGLRGAGHMRAAAAEGEAAAVATAVAQAKTLFYRALYVGEVIDVHEESVAQLTALLDDTKKRHGVGLATRYDVLRVETRLAAANADLVDALNNRTAAQLQLVDYLGADPALDIVVEGTLARVPFDATGEEAVAAALAHRPELAAGREQVAVADEWVNQARSDLLPKVKAFGHYNWTDAEGGADAGEGWVRDWNVGLSLDLSIVDGGEKRAVMKQKIVDRDLTRIAFDEIRRGVVIDARRSYDQWRHAESFVASQETAVAFAEETYRIARKRYHLGMTTQLELLDTQVSLTKANIDYRLSLFRQMVAVESLRRAMGNGNRP